MEPLPSFEQLVHALILAKLQEDVNVVTVLKKMHKLGDIRVLDRSMNLDLTHELLLSPAPLQRGLLYDLGSRNLLGLALHELIALGETTFTKEFTFHVLSIRDLSILMLDPLLNYLGGRPAWLTRSHQVRLTVAVLGGRHNWLGRRDAAACSRPSSLRSSVKRSLTIVIRHIF